MDDKAKERLMVKVREYVDGFLGYLYDRWQDEKEYEDFKEYADVMKKKVGDAFVRATKRPFGFVMKAEGGEVQVYVNSKSFGFNVR